MPTTTILRHIAGSRLFGTNLPTSDTDYWQIQISDFSDLVLRQVRDTVNETTNAHSKNTAADTDKNFIELRAFIWSALEGQTAAFESLFAPASAILESNWIWDEIQQKRDKLVTNNIGAFVGYCRGMAAKYTDKATKMIEINLLLSYLRPIAEADPKARLSSFFDPQVLLGMDYEHRRVVGAGSRYFKIVNKKHKGQSTDGEPYLLGPDIEHPMSRAVGVVVTSLEGKAASYGNRVKDAVENGNADWKAYYHALRVVWEMEEYVTTGRLTLPCPRAADLLRVRNREYSVQDFETYLNDEITRVRALDASWLPAPDYDYWNDWLVRVYKQHYGGNIG